MKSKNKTADFEEKAANVFAGFVSETLIPYFDEKFAAINNRFDENDKDHEKIFRAIERNRNEHDEMFQDIDKLKQQDKIQEKRLRKLETVAAA